MEKKGRLRILFVQIKDFLFDFGHNDVVTSALTPKAEQAQRWSTDDHYDDDDDFLLQRYDDKIDDGGDLPQRR